MIKNKANPTSLNRTVTASPPSAARATKKPSRATPFMGFFSATVLCLRETAYAVSLSQTQNRQLQPERYMPFAQKI
jgi:hypothetical protein